MLKIIALIVVCISAYQTHAQQQLVPEHVDVAATRSGNHVLTFFEDSRGILWCGAMEDLVRYDGFSVKKYSYTGNASPREAIITSIVEDRQGNIWCSSKVHGILMLPLERYGFGALKAPSFKTQLPHAHKIAFDAKGNLWGITLEKELFVFNRADSSLYVWPLTGTGALNFIGFSANGSLWIAGTKGVFFINDFAAKKLENVFDKTVLAATIESNTTYFYTQNSIYRAEEGCPVTAVANIAAVEADKGPKYIIEVTTNGLTSFIIAAIFNQPLLLTDKTTGAVMQYAFDGSNTLKYEVHCCYFSSTGRLYIGTNQGFFRVGLGNKAFKAYTGTEVKLRCVIALSADTLLFGTQGGGILRYVKQRNGQWQKDKKQPVLNTLEVPGNTVNRFYKDARGQLWMAANSGLCYVDAGVWRHVCGGFGLWGITQDSTGTFWLGTNGAGLIKFNNSTGERKAFSYIENAKTEIEKNYNKIWKTQYYKGKVYLGTASGLLMFDPATNTFAELFGSKFRGVSVWDFYLSDTLWILPTQGKGLWLYKPVTGDMKQVETVENSQYGLLWSDKKTFWVISDKGVLVHPWPGETPFSFNAYDGLNTDYLSFTGIAATNDGEVILCGENGFTVANVAQATKQNNKNHGGGVFVSSLKYSGLPVADYLPDGSNIELEYGKGQLLIEWAAAYFQQSKNRLYYKLEGVDDDWNTGSVDNKVNYTNLLPGTYVFTAYIAGIEGGNNRQYRLVIKIVPPFWLTGWFKVVVAVLTAGLLFYIIYGWAQRQKLKHAQLKSEIDALRAQINPHFIFNALNSIQAYIYTESKSEANEYLAKFASLMRKILENSREEIITLQQERAFLALYLEMEALRFRGNLTYEITIAVDCHPGVFKIPSMLLQPLVENAVKHGVNTDSDRLHIDVRFSTQNGALVCEVADNGKGFGNTAEGATPKKSLGLRLVNERLLTLSKIYRKEYRTIIGNSNANGTGAFVKIIIPQHD